MLTRDVVDLFLQHRRDSLGATKSTITTYRYALNQFTSFMENERGKLSYEEINRVDIASFNGLLKTALDDGKWSRSKFLLVVKTLKVMFKWIEEDEDCREDELKSWKAKMPKGGRTPRREFIPSISELQTFQKAFNTKTVLGLRDRMIFDMLIETGMRRGELCTLKIEHVMLGTNTLYVNGKTGPRTITMSKQLGDLVKAYIKRRQRTILGKSPYLLPSSRSIESPIDADYITKVFRRAREKSGLSHITPHTLRHAFSTYYLVNGGGEESLRLNTGHKTYDSMIHYIHLAKVHGRKAKEDMEKGSLLKMLKSQ